MSFRIVRNDITKVKADAIVNTANPEPVYGGGTDSAVYRAAGIGRMLAERRKIGRIRTGEAAVTPAFALPAKYVIHTVGPVWNGGYSGEYEALASCYRNSLEAARRLGCGSIAFPLISTGVYGFPKDRALSIALKEISDFLDKHEMDVTLVVFDRKAYELSSSLAADVREYIDEHYVEKQRKEEYGAEDGNFLRRRRHPLFDREMSEEKAAPVFPKQGISAPNAPLEDMPAFLEEDFFRDYFGSDDMPHSAAGNKRETFPSSAARAEEEKSASFPARAEEEKSAVSAARAEEEKSVVSAAKPKGKPSPPFSAAKPERKPSSPSAAEARGKTGPASPGRPCTDLLRPQKGSLARPSLSDVMRHMGESFQERLLRLIDERGLTDSEVYKRANIDRKLFSKIRCNADYTPKKRTAVALAVALELNLDETLDLLRRAGIALSPSSKFDLIVEYCIENQIYNTFEINALLFEYEQPMLGC